MNSLRIIVTGLIAQYPLGGVTWDYLQYVLGLARLGHDVYYLEDTGQWPYNPSKGGLGEDCAFNVRYLEKLFSRFGLGNRWAYCFPWKRQWFGLSDKERTAIVQSSDMLINVSGTLANPSIYRQIPCLVYIDSDPVFTQVKLARGQKDFSALVDAHDVHFSFGENMSSRIPNTGHDWRPTRQPIVLSEWHPGRPTRNVFTTIMNWTSYKPLEYKGKSFGQKDVEFKRFIDLPSLLPSPATLEIAVNTGKTRRTPRQLLDRKGWHVVHPDDVCPGLDSYRSYIESSKAEWSVAKNGYVVSQSGWFSCRSACYLAAAKPVVVQETGFSHVLPTGEGIVPFSNNDEAIEGIRDVENHYQRHSDAARMLAEEYFNSQKILSDLIEASLCTMA